MTHPPRPTPPSLSERDPAKGSREAVLVGHGNPAENCDGDCEPWIKTIDEAVAEEEAAGFVLDADLQPEGEDARAPVRRGGRGEGKGVG